MHLVTVATASRRRHVLAALCGLAILGGSLGIIAAPVSVSASSPSRRLEGLLTELWQQVLETPAAENPFATPPGGDVCWEIGPGARIVSPFGPAGADACTVGRRTPLFVVVASLECSDVEGNGNTRHELAACARGLKQDITTHELYVDGRPVRVRQVKTDPFRFILPADSLFPEPEGTVGTSVAFGWAALLPPLGGGTHTLTIHTVTASGVDSTITTTITVEHQ